MFQLERILVPVDFSEGSSIAAAHAAALARRFHSQVTLFHVNELLSMHPLSGALGFGITSWEAVRSEHLATRKKELDGFAANEFTGIDVRRILCSGDPAKLIVERGQAEKSDLILMPTYGGGAFRRFLLGSVAAKVLHDSDSPIWTGAHLRERWRTSPAEIRHVMCAVDLGPQSARAIRWASAFAKEVGATLTVTHAVLENPPNLPDRYTFQWHEEAHWGAEERLRALLTELAVDAESLVIGNGDIPKVLAATAREKYTELLVIARGSAGESPARIGSQTYAIICTAPCPVVSV